MDLDTMTIEVRQRLGEDIEDFWKTDHIHRMLNEGVRRFAMEEKWHWLYTVETGVAVAQGASAIPLQPNIDVNRHFALALVDGTRVVTPRRISPADGARLRTLGREGEPQFYFVAANDAGTTTLHLTPKANVAYTADYFYIRTPAELSTGTDEPDIPPQYQDAVVSWATGMLWLKELNGGGKAQEQFSLYREVLDQARLEQKQLSIDESVVWGRQDPEPLIPSPREWYARHLPQNI